jgi:hypothetical protein
MTYRKPYVPWSPGPGDHMDGHSIEAGNQTLMSQAPSTANEYLLSAVDHIDQKLGDGYAKAHPELIAAFMQTSAIDLGAAVIARAIETLAAATKTDEPEHITTDTEQLLDDFLKSGLGGKREPA